MVGVAVVVSVSDVRARRARARNGGGLGKSFVISPIEQSFRADGIEDRAADLAPKRLLPLAVLSG
jgi:hypothetical protein